MNSADKEYLSLQSRGKNGLYIAFSVLGRCCMFYLFPSVLRGKTKTPMFRCLFYLMFIPAPHIFLFSQLFCY